MSTTSRLLLFGAASAALHLVAVVAVDGMVPGASPRLPLRREPLGVRLVADAPARQPVVSPRGEQRGPAGDRAPVPAGRVKCESQKATDRSPLQSSSEARPPRPVAAPSPADNRQDALPAAGVEPAAAAAGAEPAAAAAGAEPAAAGSIEPAAAARASEPRPAEPSSGTAECWSEIGEQLQRRVRHAPPGLRKRGLTGKVRVRFALSEQGTATGMQVESLSGSPLLVEAARLLLQEPFDRRCPGEGRWPIDFAPAGVTGRARAPR